MNRSRAVGNRIREARNKAGLTQAELAEKVGLSVDIVSRLEKGRRYLQADEAEILCDALGISLEQLLSGVSRSKTAPARSGVQRPTGVKTWRRSERLRLMTWIACYCLAAGVLIVFPAWPLRWHALGVAVCGFFVLQLSLRLSALDMEARRARPNDARGSA